MPPSGSRTSSASPVTELRRVLVIQHEDDCPPAWLGDWLTEDGVELDVRRPYDGDDLPADLSGHDGLLVLGGPMGAYDEEPWLEPTKRLVRLAADRHVPTLGICLGHQLATVALGGSVVRNPGGQQLGVLPVGWLPAAAADPLAAALTDIRRAVHWNNDVVDRLPEGAVLLARAATGEVQAARLAPTVWGIQPHPEADEHVVTPWAVEDRRLHPEGVVDAALAGIADAHDELEATWRRLGTAFAAQVVLGRVHDRA